jgi:DNA-binding CsgD family transcriptional regulator
MSSVFGVRPGSQARQEQTSTDEAISTEDAVHFTTRDAAHLDFISRILTGHGYRCVSNRAGGCTLVRSPAQNKAREQALSPDDHLVRVLREMLPERATITISLDPETPVVPAASAPGRLADDVRERLGELTKREREVLDRIIAGQANKVIAYELSISPRTVENHRAQVMRKMRAQNVAELVRMAVAA